MPSFLRMDAARQSGCPDSVFEGDEVYISNWQASSFSWQKMIPGGRLSIALISSRMISWSNDLNPQNNRAEMCCDPMVA